MSRLGSLALAALFASLLTAAGAAQPASAAPPPSASLSPTQRLEEAKRLFRQGTAALEQGLHELALEYFLRSRELVPSYQNTRNAAICLDVLERDGEALEMYEALLADFGDALDAADRAQLKAQMAALAARTAAVLIETNVDAEVTVDGRPRGVVPRDRPLRLLAGRRRLRVTRPGYEPFETTVDVTAGVSMLVEARLQLLAPGDQPSRDVPSDPDLDDGDPGWFIEVHGGYAAGSSLGSDAELAAQLRCSAGSCPGASGALLGARMGYLFAEGLALELGAGYLDLSSTFRRTEDLMNPVSPSELLGAYELDHAVLLRHTFFSAGLSHRIPLVWRLSGLVRFTTALASAQSADAVTGQARRADGAEVLDLQIAGRDQILRSTPGLLLPEIGLTAAWDRVRLGLSLGLIISPSEGPRYAQRVFRVAGACGTAASSVACAGDSGLLTGERAYGPFLLWAPQISVASTFF